MTNKNTFNIWVYGAGAVGCYYGARLIQAGQNVLFIARGEHLEALKNNGLKVLSYRGEFELNPIQACSEEEFSKKMFRSLFFKMALKVKKFLKSFFHPNLFLVQLLMWRPLSKSLVFYCTVLAN